MARSAAIIAVLVVVAGLPVLPVIRCAMSASPPRPRTNETVVQK
jgi:hypothetical protein